MADAAAPTRSASFTLQGKLRPSTGSWVKEDDMQSKTLRRALPAVPVLAILFAGYNWWSEDQSARAEPPPGQPPIIQAVGGLPDFSAIARAYGPSVVNITTSSDQADADLKTFDGGPGGPGLDFFRHFGIPTPQPDGPRVTEGSGFIVSADGIILTNAHVVAHSSEVTVKLNDRREFKAKVLGFDRPSDVAVLKIEASGLPVVRLGDPGRLSVGEWVLAIGSPFGFENSVTAGIVSAKARALPDQDYVPFIQTDAAVNPGNSGGPLFNLRGEVIGINSQIYSRSGGYQGLSFAIPIDIAMKVQKQLMDHGKVVRGRIGASIQDMDQDLAESFGLKSADGALIASVERDSPAERAGLQPGDVVLSVDGRPVAASKDLPPLIAALKPGTEATLDIWRNRAGRQIQVKVGKLAETTPVADAQDADTGRLGLALRELSADDRRHLNAEQGLLVIEATGPAARAGVRPGDVILSANGAPLHNVEELRRMARKGTHHIALLIQRDDMRIFIPVGVG